MKTFNALLLISVACGWASRPVSAADQPAFPPISSVSGSPRLSGKFVWADLVTDDTAAAREFYSGLFGWTFHDLGGYLVAANEERPLGGMFQRPRPADRPQAKPRWFGYISVANVEKTRQKVVKAGGQVLASPRKLRGRGEQAIFADAEGALFGIIKSSSGDPPDFEADPGDWIWIQLLSRDTKKASEFYGAVCGYDVTVNPANERLSDYVLVSEGYARATIRAIPSSNQDLRPTWLPFVRVKNLPESVGLAKQLGGQVLLEPRPDLFEGRVAVLADPTGAAIGVLEWSPASLKEKR
jgi:predicted enzyme related to lactoylglutathione lyase